MLSPGPGLTLHLAQSSDCLFRKLPTPSLLPPLGAAGLRNPFRQPPPPRFIPPSGSIVALLTTVRIAPFRQPPPRRPFLPLAGAVFRSHRRSFGYGALCRFKGDKGMQKRKRNPPSSLLRCYRFTLHLLGVFATSSFAFTQTKTPPLYITPYIFPSNQHPTLSLSISQNTKKARNLNGSRALEVIGFLQGSIKHAGLRLLFCFKLPILSTAGGRWIYRSIFPLRIAAFLIRHCLHLKNSVRRNVAIILAIYPS